MARWWFQIFFIFTSYLGKIFHLTNIFQMGWIKPPTRWPHKWVNCGDFFHPTYRCFFPPHLYTTGFLDLWFFLSHLGTLQVQPRVLIVWFPSFTMFQVRVFHHPKRNHHVFLTKVATTSKGQMRVVLLPLLHFPLGDHHTRGDFPSPPRCRKKLGKWLNSACLDTYIHWFQRLLDPATQKLTQSMAKL